MQCVNSSLNIIHNIITFLFTGIRLGSGFEGLLPLFLLRTEDGGEIRLLLCGGQNIYKENAL